MPKKTVKTSLVKPLINIASKKSAKKKRCFLGIFQVFIKSYFEFQELDGR